MVTTDKVYENQEWSYGCRSLTVSEVTILAVQVKLLPRLPLQVGALVSAVMGHIRRPIFVSQQHGPETLSVGDWSQDRIVPDVMRSLAKGEPISVRSQGCAALADVVEPLRDTSAWLKPWPWMHNRLPKPSISDRV